MHAGSIALIVLGLAVVPFVWLFWWADRDHFPWRSYNDEARAPLSVAGAAGAVLVGSLWLMWLTLVGVNAFETISCEDRAAKLDTTWEYSWTAYCFIEVGGELVPYDLYRLQQGVGG